MNIQNININELEISKLNVRKNNVDNTDDDELTASIETNGLLNPLTVIFNNKSKKYEIIAGQRRFKVLKKLEHKTITCNVIPDTKNEDDQIIISLTENIHRKTMLLSDRVKTINNLTNKMNGDSEKVAELINISVRTIKQYNKISHLPDIIIDMLDAKGTDKISLEFAVHLSNLSIITMIISKEKSKSDNDYSNLIKIVQVFQDVKSSDRLSILKKVMNEKITETDFYKFFEQIGKIKIDYLKEKEIEKERDVKDHERREKEDEHDKIKKEKIIKKESIEQDNEQDSEQDSENKQFIDDKLLKIKQENNGSTHVTTSIWNPELQNVYRCAIIKRYNTCIISDMDNRVCEAAHIIPFSECDNFNIDNGLLLNCILHKLFDKHYWSINPETLMVKILNLDTIPIKIYDILEPYKDKYIGKLLKYDRTIEYLSEHYEKFKNQ